MAGHSTVRNQRVARIKARLSADAMVLMLSLAGSMLLLAASLRVGPEVRDAEADALLASLRQASARCSTTPSEPERQAGVIELAPTMK